jgi:hypothetical protein
VLTAVPFVFILAARHPYSAKSPSHQISLVAYILLASPCGHWSESSSEAPRDSQLAAGLMRSVFNRTNNENGIAAALLNGELYRLGILIAVVVLIAALALLAGRRRLSRAYRLELDANPGGVARRRTSSST